MEVRSLQEGAIAPRNSTLTARRVRIAAPPRSFRTIQLSDHGSAYAGPLLTLLFYAARARPGSPMVASPRRDTFVRRGRGPAGPDRHPARLRRVASCRLNAALAGDLLPAPALPTAACGRRPSRIPITASPQRSRRDLSLKGQERDQPLPCLRHALCRPSRRLLHRRLDGRRPRRTAGGYPQPPVPPGRCGRRPRRLLLLDRGFYNVGVIRHLQAAAAPVPDAGDLPRPQARVDPRGPSGTNVFLTWEKSCMKCTYTLHDAHKRPARGVDLRQVPLLPASGGGTRAAARSTPSGPGSRRPSTG